MGNQKGTKNTNTPFNFIDFNKTINENKLHGRTTSIMNLMQEIQYKSKMELEYHERNNII